MSDRIVDDLEFLRNQVSSLKKQQVVIETMLKERTEILNALHLESQRFQKALALYASPMSYAPEGNIPFDYSKTPQGVRPGSLARLALGLEAPDAQQQVIES